ncbi:MAG: T9SS type A sorting domain-containing protein [Chitinophagaceae bacterium]|nr:T9SS type A sorting domain-containing protein [Chitinophagaceae bacterium]
MKTSLLLLVLLALLASNTIAQCIPAIPSNAVVVNTTQTINGGFDPVWVCSGDTLYSDGGFHTIFLESGAVMWTSGGIDTIYVKSGAKFYMNGGIHFIYYEVAADLFIAGGIPTQNECVAIAFDYSNAPVNGCALLLSSFFQPSDSSICTGDCISFSNLSTNATSWEWLFPGATPSTTTDENPPSVCYNQTGSYDVTLIASNGTISDTLTLTNFITASPPTIPPILFQNGDTLFSTGGYLTYQWYYEGTIITGATDYYYVASQNGNYSVSVTSNKGCGEATAEITFIATDLGAATQTAMNFFIYPNPVSEIYSVRILAAKHDSAEITLLDCAGSLVGHSLFVVTKGENKFEFDAAKLLPGVYFLNCFVNKESKVKKLVVIH